jgi:tripartite-type tricarboxylate transporter receptor subunit TctC
MNRISVAILMLAFLAGADQALAQTYPAKPIRLIVPFAPGGSTDIVARIVAQKLSDRLTQQVVIENRGGADGTIGTEAVAKSAPDGYSLAMASTSTHAVAPSVYTKLAYDPVKDFAPISLVAVTPYLVVHPNVETISLADFIGFAKSRPGKLKLRLRRHRLDDASLWKC